MAIGTRPAVATAVSGTFSTVYRTFRASDPQTRGPASSDHAAGRAGGHGAARTWPVLPQVARQLRASARQIQAVLSGLERTGVSPGRRRCARRCSCKQQLFGFTERRRSRTYPAWGYQTSPVLKTGWATGPMPLHINRSRKRSLKKGVHGETSKPRANAAAKPRVLARGDESSVAKGGVNMVSPILMRLGHRAHAAPMGA